MFQTCWNCADTVSLKMGRQHWRGRTSISRSWSLRPTHMWVTQSGSRFKPSGHSCIDRYENLANIFTLSDPWGFMNTESGSIVPTRWSLLTNIREKWWIRCWWRSLGILWSGSPPPLYGLVSVEVNGLNFYHCRTTHFPNMLRFLSLVGLWGRLFYFHLFGVGGFSEIRIPVHLAIYTPYSAGQRPLCIFPLNLSLSRIFFEINNSENREMEKY